MIITLKACKVPGCEGADHRWEWARPTAREILRIQEATGQDVNAWSEGLNLGLEGGTAGLLAALALVDVLHRRDGIKVPFEDIDLDVFSLEFEPEPGEIEQADEGQGDGEDEAGKGPGPTSLSLPPEDAAPGAGPVSTSGPEPEAASAPRSSPTPTTSGGTSASP